MKRIFYLTAIFCTMFTNSICAQEKDYAAELQKDVVVIKDGKYTMEKIVMLKTPTESGEIGTSQFKYFASAPTTAISRDNFVYFSAVLFEEITEDSDAEELEELIGDPDVAVNVIMAKNGIQIQTIANGTTDRTTMTWKKMLSGE
ncbi:MAG: hypothetical protein J6U04_00665 [Salinivirgaceae bacterium]|nr:hypothetical protein [Salinivirgaceae bacterium]